MPPFPTTSCTAVRDLNQWYCTEDTSFKQSPWFLRSSLKMVSVLWALLEQMLKLFRWLLICFPSPSGYSPTSDLFWNIRIYNNSKGIVSENLQGRLKILVKWDTESWWGNKIFILGCLIKRMLNFVDTTLQRTRNVTQPQHFQ